MLEIRLLGEQLVAGGANPGGRPPSSRSVALLAYLVLHARESPRPGRIWPGSSGRTQRNRRPARISDANLHKLRTLARRCPSLVVEPTTLSWCDSRVLSGGCPCVPRRASGGVVGEVRPSGRVRSACRGGDRRISGRAHAGVYDDWVLEEREHLRRQCVEMCDLAAAPGANPVIRAAAIELARRRVQLEPLEEVVIAFYGDPGPKPGTAPQR